MIHYYSLLLFQQEFSSARSMALQSSHTSSTLPNTFWKSFEKFQGKLFNEFMIFILGGGYPLFLVLLWPGWIVVFGTLWLCYWKVPSWLDRVLIPWSQTPWSYLTRQLRSTKNATNSEHPMPWTIIPPHEGHPAHHQLPATIIKLCPHRSISITKRCLQLDPSSAWTKSKLWVPTHSLDPFNTHSMVKNHSPSASKFQSRPLITQEDPSDHQCPNNLNATIPPKSSNCTNITVPTFYIAEFHK